MELKTFKHLDRPSSTSVSQPLPHETPYEETCHDVSPSDEFNLKTELRSKSSNISIRKTSDVFGGVRQEEAKNINASEKNLTVRYKDLSLRRPVSELSNVNNHRCDVQSINEEKAPNIRTSIYERESCMYGPSEYTGNIKRRVSHIKTNEFRPAIHPIDSDMPSPSPLEL